MTRPWFIRHVQMTSVLMLGIATLALVWGVFYVDGWWGRIMGACFGVIWAAYGIRRLRLVKRGSSN